MQSNDSTWYKFRVAPRYAEMTVDRKGTSVGRNVQVEQTSRRPRCHETSERGLRKISSASLVSNSAGRENRSGVLLSLVGTTERQKRRRSRNEKHQMLLWSLFMIGFVLPVSTSAESLMWGISGSVFKKLVFHIAMHVCLRAKIQNRILHSAVSP
jgi:hypothetical protein